MPCALASLWLIFLERTEQRVCVRTPNTCSRRQPSCAARPVGNHGIRDQPDRQAWFNSPRGAGGDVGQRRQRRKEGPAMRRRSLSCFTWELLPLGNGEPLDRVRTVGISPGPLALSLPRGERVFVEIVVETVGEGTSHGRVPTARGIVGSNAGCPRRLSERLTPTAGFLSWNREDGLYSPPSILGHVLDRDSTAPDSRSTIRTRCQGQGGPVNARTYVRDRRL